MPESDALAFIKDAARTFGWLYWHQRPAYEHGKYASAIQGDSGFPDCVLCHPAGALIFAEVKARDQRNQVKKPTEAQRQWLTALATVAESNPSVHCALWVWPDAREEILWRLQDVPTERIGGLGGEVVRELERLGVVRSRIIGGA